MPFRRFFGKYRGKVNNNIDPLELGRLQVSVPYIYAQDRLSWAMPCTPYGGKDVGFFALPPVGANIWVEFEAGDPDYPIWSGCFWGINENPAQLAALPAIKMFKTESFMIRINDLPGAGKLSIEANPPAVTLPLKLVMDSTGIEINNNDITTVKLKPDSIEVKVGETSIITLQLQDITLEEGTVSMKLSLTGIDLTSTPATFKLSNTGGVELGNLPATAKVCATGVELGYAESSIKVAPAIIDISNAAASIKLSPATVSVNNGALEVI
jgi:hypothetical protein